VNPTLGCSSKVSVSSLSNEKVRRVAIIFAEDANSGETIRCDVIVDAIKSLQIVTKTRELFVGDAPELFEVSAFDDQGTYLLSKISISCRALNIMLFVLLKTYLLILLVLLYGKSIRYLLFTRIFII